MSSFKHSEIDNSLSAKNFIFLFFNGLKGLNLLINFGKIKRKTIIGFNVKLSKTSNF
jgi:hypothetical protein